MKTKAKTSYKSFSLARASAERMKFVAEMEGMPDETTLYRTALSAWLEAINTQRELEKAWLQQNQKQQQ